MSEDDLDDLDDYLDEFQDEILSKPAEELAKEAEEMKGEEEEELNEDELAGQLESVLKELGEESPEAKAQLEALMKNFAEFENQVDVKKQEPTPTNLKDTISSTLNRLKESGNKVDQSIKDEQPDQLLENLLGQLDLGEDGFDIGNLLGELLDQLASKAVLYEPLKDLSVKYPKWIEENKDSVTEEELIRYNKQSDIVQSIVSKFEEESYSDASDKEFISAKLEEMQNSGNPPNDLMGDLSKTGLPGFQFDGEDMPDDIGKDLEKDLESCQQQ